MSQAATPETGFKATWRAIDEYWFGLGSATTLGVFRIFVGALSLINFINIGLHWESWYSEKGYVPAWLGQLWLRPNVALWSGGPEVPRIDLINGVTDPRITLPFFLLIGVFSVLTMVGLWTRFSSIALAILLVSLHHRNSAVLHGGDTVIRIWVLYIAVAPSGAACSLDRLIQLWKGKIPAAPAVISVWAQRLISYNVALLYFTTTWLKFDGVLWRNGTATYYTAHLAEFRRFPVPDFVNHQPMVMISSYATLAVEFALGTLIFFRPLRRYVVITGVLLHLYIDYSMNIPLFSYLMISSYITFYEGEEVEACIKRWAEKLRKFRIRVRFPGSRLQPGPAAFLAAVDPFDLVSYEPGTGDWSAERSDGSPVSPFPAARWRSLGALPFSWIPNLWPRLLRQALEPDREP